jgi:hypothetical protein
VWPIRRFPLQVHLHITTQAQDHSIPMSASFPLDARIPISLKRKIWANEFVELLKYLNGNISNYQCPQAIEGHLCSFNLKRV